MVRMEDEQDVEGSLEHGVRLVLRHADPEQHVQEIGRVGELVLGIDVG